MLDRVDGIMLCGISDVDKQSPDYIPASPKEVSCHEQSIALSVAIGVGIMLGSAYSRISS